MSTLDPSVRASFSLTDFASCGTDAIKDHTLDVTVSSADLARLVAFIDEGRFQ